MGMFKVADMKGDKRYDTYKLTKQWAVYEDDIQEDEEWKRDEGLFELTEHWAVYEDYIQKNEEWKRDEGLFETQSTTELLMKMIIRRMKDYLKLTEHWAVDEDDNEKDKE